MRLRHFVMGLVLLVSCSVMAEGWRTVDNGREIHYRTYLPNNTAMLDIACSVNLRVLLGASFISHRGELVQDFGIIVDGKNLKNFMNPSTPADHSADYYRFWNTLKNAKKLEVVSDGEYYSVDTTNLKEQLPETYDPKFACRPVTTTGLLVP